ncbi:hypothetical protein LTS10_004337 [Elasticomyces elasticus]|nr:hypothetical protein LTS10_004337 [Elasticomyces elasticus]
MAGNTLHPSGSSLVFAPTFPSTFFDPKWIARASDVDIAAALVPYLFTDDEVDLLRMHGPNKPYPKGSNNTTPRFVGQIRDRVVKARAIREKLEGMIGSNELVPVAWYMPPPPRSSKGLEGACTIAKLGAFYDTQLRSSLGRKIYEHLRTVEPRLLPWSLGESIESVNSNILTNSPVSGCLPDFDWLHFENTDKLLPDKKVSKATTLWCAEHRRWECYWIMQPLWYQLGAGRLSFEEYAMIVTRVPSDGKE